MSLGRRVAAALNAPDMIPPGSFKFFWIAAVTTDGTIVVANSYGIGYIPQGVDLPAQVQMASADESIPVVERARWATYPIVTLQGWAAHHDKRLRAIIGTTADLKGLDAGLPTVNLDEQDIPTSGKMQGRNRLEVVAPAIAERLTAIADTRLVELLPAAGADIKPPEDRTAIMWFDVIQPMMSSVSDRNTKHLEAFQIYTVHAAEVDLYHAHTALNAAAQRAAITDYHYWLYQYDTLTDALAD